MNKLVNFIFWSGRENKNLKHANGQISIPQHVSELHIFVRYNQNKRDIFGLVGILGNENDYYI